MPTWWGKKKNNRNAELNRSILKDLNILKNNYAKKRTIRKTKKGKGEKKEKKKQIPQNCKKSM